jgi:cbb3-type cytochrome oxidase subunit 3
MGRIEFGHGYKPALEWSPDHRICDGRQHNCNRRPEFFLNGCNRIGSAGVRWDDQRNQRPVNGGQLPQLPQLPHLSQPTTSTTMDITGMLAVIFFFSCAFGVVYIIFSTRHRERMAMIERGIDLSTRKADPNPRKALKEGMQWVGAALGLGLGYIIDINTDVEKVWVYLGSVAFFVGLANIIYHLIFSKKALMESEAGV